MEIKIKTINWCLSIDYEKLLDKYKTIGTKIKDLKTIELNALSVYDNRYIKTKIRTYDANVYTNFCDLNVPKYAIECEYFTVISIDSLLVYESKYYVQVYLVNWAYKTANKAMKDYIDENIFEDKIL